MLIEVGCDGMADGKGTQVVGEGGVCKVVAGFSRYLGGEGMWEEYVDGGCRIERRSVLVTPLEERFLLQGSYQRPSVLHIKTVTGCR